MILTIDFLSKVGIGEEFSSYFEEWDKNNPFLLFWKENKLDGLDSDWIKGFEDPWGYFESINYGLCDKTYSFDQNVVKVTGRNGSWTKRFLDSNNNILRFETSRGYYKQYYCRDDRNISMTLDSDNEWTFYFYDDFNNLLGVTTSRITTDDVHISGTEFVYDINQNLVKIMSSCGWYADQTYDKHNRIIRFESPKYWETYKYHENGKLVSTIDSDGFSEEYIYDSSGERKMYRRSNGTTIKYDNGRLASIEYDGNVLILPWGK